MQIDKVWIAMDVQELVDLPAAVDLVTAARAFDIGRTKAHELARAGEFPVPVLHIGRKRLVRRSDLLTVLGVETQLQGGDVT